MKPEGSLPHSQVPATCPYPEPARSSPYPHIQVPEDPSQYYPPIYAWVAPVHIRGPVCEYFVTGYVLRGEKLLALRPTPKLENNLLSAVSDCLFIIFAATLHMGGRSSIRNLRTRHAVVSWTHLSHGRTVTQNINNSLLTRPAQLRDIQYTV
jgi:hypothetical protein